MFLPPLYAYVRPSVRSLHQALQMQNICYFSIQNCSANFWFSQIGVSQNVSAGQKPTATSQRGKSLPVHPHAHMCCFLGKVVEFPTPLQVRKNLLFVRQMNAHTNTNTNTYTGRRLHGSLQFKCHFSGGQQCVLLVFRQSRMSQTACRRCCCPIVCVRLWNNYIPVRSFSVPCFLFDLTSSKPYQLAFSGNTSRCYRLSTYLCRCHFFRLVYVLLFLRFSPSLVCSRIDFICAHARPLATQLFDTHVFHIWPGISQFHLRHLRSNMGIPSIQAKLPFCHECLRNK